MLREKTWALRASGAVRKTHAETVTAPPLRVMGVL